MSLISTLTGCTGCEGVTSETVGDIAQAACLIPIMKVVAGLITSRAVVWRGASQATNTLFTGRRVGVQVEVARSIPVAVDVYF